MCVVFIAHQTPGLPAVMIGANREEARNRPTTSPVCCRSGALRCLLAGADHGPDGTFPAAGTWLGVNEAGLAVAVTNRSDGGLAWADQTRSKGLLAVDLLAFEHAGAAARHALAELQGGGFGGCNYLIADAETAFVVAAPGASSAVVRRLVPGVHVMTNGDVDDRACPRVRLVLDALDPRDFRASARRLCRDGRIIIDGATRGTISSSLLIAGEPIMLEHRLGDPRAGDYERFQLPGRAGDGPAGARLSRGTGLR